jgi:uncharacterized membrane protein
MLEKRGVGSREWSVVKGSREAVLIFVSEFMLAADIVRTAISPTWQQTGRLAATAVIRMFINYFPERDI